jgi:hypothetical protein
MAFYIELNKTNGEQEDFVYYFYEFYLPIGTFRNAAGKLRGKSKLVKGKIKINRKSGDIDIIELAEGDNQMYVQRAAWALKKHWKLGEFPDKTCWAS